ncbi:insulin-like growth factor binding protein [Naematelia encephala]|uniref:Insulin-like growth factor binding protein n=1 Tax=Naematelia encephala TaxID=71784 RepID=A0A1Y2AUM4_9TREE|nr:insulin-like growth factor binding protein [Naematelia encephala]
MLKTLTILILVSHTLASQVCSPQICIDGSTISPLLAADKATDKHLIPGTYTASDSSSLSPTSFTNQTIAHTTSSLVISPPPQPITFTGKDYTGYDYGYGGVNWGEDWSSLFLPEGWYGVLQPGKVLWGAIPDTGDLPSELNVGKMTKAALSTCNPPCSSHSLCTRQEANSTAQCQCDIGWTGSACDTCSPGFYGPTCLPCPASCSECDDGLLGTGTCVGTTTTPASCNCGPGTCQPDGGCTCASGWLSNSTISTQACNQCANGFFQDTNGNCLACPLGCDSCTLKSGTDNAAVCTSCASGLSLSSAGTATCVAKGSCSDGQYFDESSSSCKSCSPACKTCTGPSTSDCLACASPRASLNGTCVGYDSSNGVCDSSLSGLQGVFVVDNEQSLCEACPAGCLTCFIPSFSSVAKFSNLQCQSCQHGYLLENGSCVKTCSDGNFVPTGSAQTNGTCQPCDSSKCSTCLGSADYCTRCADTSTSASEGQCIATCPDSTISSNGTCLSCHSECSSCSVPGSATACTACPSSRPALINGRCVEYCPSNQYLDSSTSTCKACDTSCLSCSGSDTSHCTRCTDGHVLKLGKCQSVTCDFATGLGLCLKSLIASSRNSLIAVYIVVPLLLLVIGLVGWWLIMKERRKTRQATREFARGLDESGVKDRMMILRFEKVFGLDRLHYHFHSSTSPSLQPTDSDVEIELQRSDKDKKRLRELLLPSFRRRNENSFSRTDKDIPMIDRFVPPPPPYIDSPSTVETRMIPLSSKTKVVSMDSPTSPIYEPTSLQPPPRTLARQGSVNGKERMGDNEVIREAEREARLSDVWPAIRREEARKLEGWI